MEILGTQVGINKLSAQTIPHRLSEIEKTATAGKINVGQWERIASGVFGFYLIYRAIKNRSLFSVLAAAPALGLISRAFSGQCAIYRKMGMSSAGAESKATSSTTGSDFASSGLYN